MLFSNANLFEYCFNNPINFSDPSGYAAKKDIDGGIRYTLKNILKDRKRVEEGNLYGISNYRVYSQNHLSRKSIGNCGPAALLNIVTYYSRVRQIINKNINLNDAYNGIISVTGETSITANKLPEFCKHVKKTYGKKALYQRFGLILGAILKKV